MTDVKALVIGVGAGGDVHRELRVGERLVDADGNPFTAMPGLGNRRMAALNASIDGALATNTALANDPSDETGQAIRVFVNGLLVSVGDGDKVAACYFSDDDGATAKLLDSLALGDKLYWVPTVAGYPLIAGSFELDFVYEL